MKSRKTRKSLLTLLAATTLSTACQTPPLELPNLPTTVTYRAPKPLPEPRFRVARVYIERKVEDRPSNTPALKETLIIKGEDYKYTFENQSVEDENSEGYPFDTMIYEYDELIPFCEENGIVPCEVAYHAYDVNHPGERGRIAREELDNAQKAYEDAVARLKKQGFPFFKNAKEFETYEAKREEK